MNLKFFGKAKTESITFIDLNYNKKKGDELEVEDDLSNISLAQTNYVTPLLTGELDSIPQIPIIGIGQAGIRITNQIAKRFKAYGIDYPLMAIDIDKTTLDQADLVTNKILIQSDSSSTSKQFLVGEQLLKKEIEKIKTQIQSYIEKVVQKSKQEMVFLILGSGGTGVGVGISIASLLIESGRRPVPFFILPGNNESTRIRFNAAVALYHFNYAPKDRCMNLVTICIDNEYFFERNSRNNMTECLALINERVGATIADIVVSTKLESHGYNVDLNDMMEIFREIRGIAVLTYIHGEGSIETLNSFFNQNINNSNSLNVDVFNTTRAYLFIQVPKNHVTVKVYRDLIDNFENMDMFTKFNEVEEGNYNIRGIFSGFGVNSRIENLMQLAEEARIDLINKEINNSAIGKGNIKIDQLKEGSKIDVKTNEEAQKERMNSQT